MKETFNDRDLRDYAAVILSDGQVDNDEIKELYKWLTNAANPSESANDLLMLIKDICADNVVHTIERIQLLTALKNICNQADSKEKGDAFERYVITRFDNREYRLIEWCVAIKKLRVGGGPFQLNGRIWLWSRLIPEDDSRWNANTKRGICRIEAGLKSTSFQTTRIMKVGSPFPSSLQLVQVGVLRYPTTCTLHH